jgi:hypothetical protein
MERINPCLTIKKFLARKIYIIKENYFRNNAIKRQMQQKKRKILNNKHSEHRCTNIHVGIYTKQIGNCLDILVLAKQAPQCMKTLSKEIVKKESQFSQIVKYHKSYKLGKECHIKFYNHTLVRHMMSMKHYLLNLIADIVSERTIYVELSLKKYG